MKPRIIALDIYGTVLASDDSDNVYPPRRGFFEFMTRAVFGGARVVSSSDASLDVLKCDLRESGIDPWIFWNMYHLNQPNYKDMSLILEGEGISASELLVVGDSEKDRLGAEKVGAKFFLVPKYVTRRDGQPRDNFSLTEILGYLSYKNSFNLF